MILLLLATLSAPPPPGQPAPSFAHATGDARQSVRAPWDPTSAYEVRTVLGWKVLVNKGFLASNPGVAERVIVHLEDHLYRIGHKVPPRAVAKLREIPIWIEEKHPKHPCMCYHVSAEWLRSNAMNPEKAGAVEISNGLNFLDWTKQQPWMVLHELAHAYHHRFLSNGHDNAEVLAAYKNAMDKKLYDSVLDSSGNMRRHYACTNQMEYFAEATEAYFGANDFYPFVRAELKVHDPVCHALMGKLWNE